MNGPKSVNPKGYDILDIKLTADEWDAINTALRTHLTRAYSPDCKDLVDMISQKLRYHWGDDLA